MNLDDRLDRARDELADEVASDVRVPSFAGVLARRARRRRLQMTAGGVAVVVVAAGVVGGVAATRPGPHRSVQPAVTVSVSPAPTASPTTVPSGAQTYPARGSSYVVVPDGDQLAWTDLKTGAHGHFGPADGRAIYQPSVSADGRRIVFVETSLDFQNASIDYWDLDSHTGGTLASSSQQGMALVTPIISPDGKRVVFNSPDGFRLATIGASQSAVTAPASVQGAVGVTWSGDDALVYLPADSVPGYGGICAVKQVTLSASASRCLLPTATLQALPAPNGSSWRVGNVSSASDTDLLALTVVADKDGGPTSEALAVLDPSAEATPFHLLGSTVATNNAAVADTYPQLIDRGTRVAYVEIRNGGQRSKVTMIKVVPVDGGSPTTVVSNDMGTGLGATSG